MTASVTAFIAMGSNLGDRRRTLLTALGELDAAPGCRVERVSSFIETEPVGPGVQGRYINAAVQVSTRLAARPLLGALMSIERKLGRERVEGERWGPRTVDLDLLLYGDHVIDEPGLTVPHPRMHERVFVLAPLAEIAAGAQVPGRAVTVGGLLAALEGRPA